MQQFDTDWRRTAAALYRKPTDSKIIGSVEFDVTELEEYISAKRKSGLKITMTHVFLLATARAFRDVVPEFNCYVRRGKVVPRPTIDATLSVLIQGGTEMGSVLIPSADAHTLQSLAAFLEQRVPETRKGTENELMQRKKTLANIPWPFRRWVVSAIKYLTVEWGFSLPKQGISANSFGSYIFSNIGSVGLDIGYPALMPAANLSLVLIMGSVRTKPGVVDGKVVPRRILNMGAALDHRVVDAVHGGRLFNYLKGVVKRPEVLE